jgi:hypothetical protein
MTNTIRTTIRNVETMLREADENRAWGAIEITLKEGQPTLIRKTTQHKADEDIPANGSHTTTGP